MKLNVYTLAIVLFFAINTACRQHTIPEPYNETGRLTKEASYSSDGWLSGNNSSQSTIPLPPPKNFNENDISLEQALLLRRSIRSYSPGYLTLEQISQLLWAGQGITERTSGYRTAPSAGATYPLELYLVAGEVQGLEPGVYRYLPDTHEIQLITSGDKRADLYQAALRQSSVYKAQINLVFTALYERTTQRYGERGIRYVHMEVGHAAQNVYLQAGTIGLGTVVIGAFDDQEVQQIIQLPIDEIPLYIMPVGIR